MTTSSTPDGRPALAAAQVLVGRPGHFVYTPLFEGKRLTQGCRCECGSTWAPGHRSTWARWAMDHETPTCSGGGERIAVVRTDGAGEHRTECETCRRFVTTTAVPGSFILRTIDSHVRRRPLVVQTRRIA